MVKKKKEKKCILNRTVRPISLQTVRNIVRLPPLGLRVFVATRSYRYKTARISAEHD